MKYKDREKIATKYKTTPELLSQWLRSLNLVRNIVCHHGRLWNVNIVERSDFIKSFPNDKLIQKVDSSKSFGYFYIMADLLKVTNPTSTWQNRLQHHIDNFPLPKNKAVQIDDFGYLKEIK